MPISRPDAIPIVGNIIWENNPDTILDIGVGFGIWGALFRAWTDIRMAEIEPERYDNWDTIIDGIEIFAEYEHDLWLSIYDDIFIGDAQTLLYADYSSTTGILLKGQMMPTYDHIHMGDVIEHMSKEDGLLLIQTCQKRLTPGGTITVVTPNGYRPQGAVLGNLHEEHKCGWYKEDFESAGAEQIWGAGNQLVAMFQS